MGSTGPTGRTPPARVDDDLPDARSAPVAGRGWLGACSGPAGGHRPTLGALGSGRHQRSAAGLIDRPGMDAAIDEPLVALAKFLSVPLLIGVPVALSWPRASFVVRGIVLAEVIAMSLRLGWLSLISPQRLCSNYLLD